VPRTTHDDDDDYDADRDYDPDDRETWPDGLYDDDGPPAVPCRACGEEMYEGAEQCPGCGAYQSDEDAGQPSRRGTWMTVLLLLALLAALMMAVG